MTKTRWFPVDGWPGLLARNPIRMVGKVAYVTLTRGQVAIIDWIEVPFIAPQRWWAVWPNGKDKTPYAVATVDGWFVGMHRYILTDGNPDSPVPMVDHRDGKGLDNRRDNLRPVTRSQNAQNLRGARKDNRSGVRNVTITAVNGITYYWVRVKRDGKTVGQKHFPFTPEGLVLATGHARALRAQHLTHTDGR